MAKYTFELRELFEPIKFNPPIYTRSQVEDFFKDYELSDYLTQEQIDVINNAGIWSKDKLARKIAENVVYYDTTILADDKYRTFVFRMVQ